MGKVKVWYDSEGDYLEVMFEKKEGYFRETESDQIMEKVDMEGNVIGFSILKDKFPQRSSYRSCSCRQKIVWMKKTKLTKKTLLSFKPLP